MRFHERSLPGIKFRSSPSSTTPMSRPRRTLRAAVAVIVSITAGATTVGVLAAHDFWLVPDAFAVTPGGWVEVSGQTSSAFPTSESAVALDRVADARLLSAKGAEKLTGLLHAGTSLRIRHRPTEPGQYLVTMALKPRAVRESAEGFRRYLVLEGAAELAERYEREGRLPTRDSVTRRYAKYAKTVVEVGRGGPRAYTQRARHPLEFVPLTDPSALRAGDSLRVRLLYDSRPLAAAHLHASVAAGPATTASGSSANTSQDLSLMTDAEGLATIPVARTGAWNVRTIHIVPATPGSGADWDTHWATFVFPVAPGASSTTVASSGGALQSDSAAVAAAVLRYHAALESGDSLAAIALLADDAIVLESGGVESRAEYRSHHLASDIAFARAVKAVRSPVRVVVRGDAAWATSTSTTQGQYRDRTINSVGAELMVLTRSADGWKIAAIHWSSRARRS